MIHHQSPGAYWSGKLICPWSFINCMNRIMADAYLESICWTDTWYLSWISGFVLKLWQNYAIKYSLSLCEWLSIDNYSCMVKNMQLDYAARDKDGPQVWQCYENIVVAVNDILSRIEWSLFFWYWRLTCSW